jgi:hypothetical protein
VGVEDSSDDPEEEGHEDKSNKQGPSSTESLNTKDDEDGSGDNLGILARFLCAGNGQLTLTIP